MNSQPSYSTRTDSEVSASQRIAKAFEQAWHKGQEPQIEAYLRECPAETEPGVFEMILRIDIDCRRQRGKPLPLDQYVKRFPKHQSLIQSVHQSKPHQQPASSETVDLQENWYYLRNRLPVGPFAFDQLKKLALSGDLRPKDLVSSRGSPQWVEAASVAGLFAGPSATKEVKAPVAGQWIRDDYVLLEAVGRGGMGEVFKAYRFSLKKEVALKIVRFDRFQKLSPAWQQTVLENFQKEMQATANLRHDHIVAIHDAGDHNGLPFYTMDFVELNLSRIIQFGPLPGKKAAEYMEKIARAVDFANQKGIVHRDIKPPNILIDAGKPILADLGLAAVREKLREGQERGDIVGTPPYMAPEQALGHKCDHRTDVYGLGATLYHLVTGRPPHQAADGNSVLEQVIHEEPLPPRRLNSALDRDLEAVILKCLEKEPERRYPSAGVLADDLKRFQEGHPVSAQRLTWIVRITKWARREPIKAGLAGGVLLLLLILFVGGYISNRWLSGALAKAEVEKERADQEAKAAEKAREVAEEERGKARVMASLLGKRVLDQIKGRDVPQSLDELQKHVDFLEQQVKKGTQEEIKLDLAATYQDLGAHMLKIGKRTESIGYLVKCIGLQTELAKQNPILKVEIGLNYMDLGNLYGLVGRRDLELDADLKGLKILQELRDEDFNEPVILAALGQAHMLVGVDYRHKGDRDTSIKHQKDAVQILEKLNEGDNKNAALFQFAKELGKAYQELGNTFRGQQPQDSLAYYEKAKRIFEHKGQHRRNLAEVNLGLGNAYLDLNDKDNALPPLNEAQAMAEQLLKESTPNSPQADLLRILSAQITSALARAYQQKGDSRTAEQMHRDSLKLRQELAARPNSSPAVLIDGLSDFALFYFNENKLDQAVAYQDQAILLQEKWIQEETKDYLRRRFAGILLYNKASWLSNKGRDEEALISLLRAQKHETDAFKDAGGTEEYARYLSMTHKNLFAMQMRLRRYEEAVDTIIERVKLWPTDKKRHREAAEDLAKVYEHGANLLYLKIEPFFEQGLKANLLSAEFIRGDRRYERLFTNPAFEKLIMKYGG
jgi:tetratricopeptide (TPR) repeat protein